MAEENDIIASGSASPSGHEDKELNSSSKAGSKRLIPRLLFAGTLLGLVVWGLIWLVKLSGELPSLSEIENPTSVRSSELYFEGGEVLGYLHAGENRVVVELDQISPHLINALIVTEDKRFYEHPGIDPMAIPSVLYRYFADDKVSGASTISMQLARNLHQSVGREKTIRRKLKEIMVASLIERNFTKSEILHRYLNTVNIYGNCYGVQTAAFRLFNKEAKDLSIEESAFIVGLLKGQGEYNPRKYPEKARERRDVVLGLMADNKLLGNAELDSLLSLDLQLAMEEEQKEPEVAPYFRERIRLWLEEWASLNGHDIYRDGLKVYTTLDYRIQQHAETAVREHMRSLQQTFSAHIRGREPWRNEPGMLDRMMKLTDRYHHATAAGKSEEAIRKEFETPVRMMIFSWDGEKDSLMSPMDSIRYHSRFLETGMASIEPSTGKVKAWVGGINYKYFKYDHVELSKRQVGSTFKPFVYTAAIDNGWRPCERELNQPVYFYDRAGNVVWAPENAGESLGGYVTLKKALEYSLNVITARLAKQLGIQVIIDYAHMLGIQSPIEPHPAVCLGTADLSVLEMAGAYCTFANNGMYNEPWFISRIEDENGNLIESFEPLERRALSEKTTYIMLDMLKGVVDDHYGTGAGLKDRFGLSGEIGGKTGTTQDHSDGWFMGITSNLVTAIWVGAAERKMRFSNLRYGQGAYMAMPIFGKFYHKVTHDPSLGMPVSHFDRPANFSEYLDCQTEVVYASDPDPYHRFGRSEDKKEELSGWE
jgi:penicillin-binding protein 1A